MAGVTDYNTDPNLNLTINGIDIAELCAAADLNDAIRQMMADVRVFYNAYTTAIGGVPTTPVSLANGGTGQTTAVNARAALLALDIAYRQLPQSAQNAAFAFDLTQGAGHVYYTGAAANATIPLNASVAFPTGTAITVVNNGSGALGIVRTGGVTLKWAATGANADRSLATGGMATILKVATDTWFVSGAGLT